MQSDLICICWKILIPVLTVWYFKTTCLLKRCAELIMFCKVCMYYVADPSFELIMFYEVWMYYIFSFFCFFVCTIHYRQSIYCFALSKPNWSENQKCIVFWITRKSGLMHIESTTSSIPSCDPFPSVNKFRWNFPKLVSRFPWTN